MSPSSRWYDWWRAPAPAPTAIKKSLRMADLHVRDYSPWEGWPVEGWPTTLFFEGKS